MATILLVDDRRDSELVLGQQLQAKGFSVRTLNQSNHLHEMLSGGGIDAILMDMNMPEMDGCEATLLIKSDESLKHIPIIICTSHPLPGDDERARKCGSDGFVSKPINMDVLQSLLAPYFEGLTKVVLQDETQGGNDTSDAIRQ
jgi:two-component system, cell cycle response regulator DivK